MIYFRAMKRLLFILLMLTTMNSIGQKTSKKNFTLKKMQVIHSDKSYETSLQFANKVGMQLDLILDHGVLKLFKGDGLSFGKHTCMENFGSYPCYVPRGRYDDGAYNIIEYSNDYSGFAKGYYMVMAAMFDSENNEVKILHDKATTIYRDAYIKTTDVYMDCIH